MKKLIALIMVFTIILTVGAVAAAAEDEENNIALGAAYAYSDKQPITSNGGDADTVKLTDGIKAASASLWNGEWVVFESNAADNKATVLVDLGNTYSLTAVSSNFLQDYDSGAFPPATLKVFAGTETDNLTEIASVSYDSNGLTGANTIPFTKTLDAAVNARYVEFRFEGLSYSWNTYFGIDEIIVYGEPASDLFGDESSDVITSEAEISEQTGTDIGEQSEEQSVNSEDTSEKQTTPETGDNFNYILIGTVITAVILSAAAMINRRKRNI